MTKIARILMLLCLVWPTLVHARINGEMQTVQGIPVVRVWGTPYEMGYAQGYLLSEAIKATFMEFVMPLVLHQAPIYNTATDLFASLYAVPEPYLREAQGLIDGALAAGTDLYVPALGRAIDTRDIHTAGAMADIVGLFACSSLIAWSGATADDPALGGDAALVRNLDWFALPSDPTVLARATVLVARAPVDRRRTVSVAFPGFLGCLSCMNDAGVVVVQHQSHPGIPLLQIDFEATYVPINLAVREGLELGDPDGDGDATLEDPALVIQTFPRSSSYTLGLADANPEQHAPFILEANGEGTARRYDLDDPDFPAGTLGVTNHMRKLKKPKYCRRYNTIRDNVNAWNGQITLERMWQNNRNVTMKPLAGLIGSVTSQTMVFLPAQRRVGLAYSDKERLSPEKEPAWLDWDEMFQGVPVDDDGPADDPPQEADDDDATDPEKETGLNAESEECGCG